MSKDPVTDHVPVLRSVNTVFWIAYVEFDEGLPYAATKIIIPTIILRIVFPWNNRTY